MSLNRLSVLLGALIIAPCIATAAPVSFSVSGADAASIQGTVDKFRVLLGELNPNEPTNFEGGRRQINWDAAPDFISDPNAFPGDFFNGEASPRARGIEFQATGTTEGFRLSANPDVAGADPFFGNGDEFVPFSNFRMFSPVAGNTFDVLFFDPLDQVTQATTHGLGVVFNGVDGTKTSSTFMNFFDINDQLILSQDVTAAPSGGVTFAGALFDTSVVAKVSIQSGNSDPFASNLFQNSYYDAVVMDDFIFGEPTPVAPVPVPASVLLLGSALLGGGLVARRQRAQRA